MADAVIKAFEITTEGMGEVSSRLTKEFNKGLEREGDDVKVKMLVTYVHSLPDGSEEGDFLALDLGGSNFRVLLIRIKDKKDTQIVTKRVIDDETKQSTQERLFDFIAESVADFIKEQNITSKLPLGFTFSFPVHQTSLISGTLIRWTKDFTATGAVGQDVVKLLHDAFQRRGDVSVDVVALVNDTTGTQLAVGYNDPDCHIGVILGTGTNACYMENLDRVGKFPGDRSRYSQVIINTEWGAFGDDGTLENWLTEFDKELDKQVLNPGQQTYEKCISGKYLGEISRLAMQKLVKVGQLFGGKSSPLFDKFEGFETKYVSIIEGSDSKECQRIFKEEFGIEASAADCDTVRRVCEAVSTRAARLAAAGIVALVRKIDKLGKCTVAIDGTLYKKHPTFRGKMRAAMNELAPGNGITIKESEDGSGRGAAIVAAVACRLRDEGAFK